LLGQSSEIEADKFNAYVRHGFQPTLLLAIFGIALLCSAPRSFPNSEKASKKVSVVSSQPCKKKKSQRIEEI
jgi:hypothetical protein